ncbi:MAG: lamin tail domain-containing protein [Candidatus Sungbacteria bacterium]|nr:lamin tail domain-containing protein [Candidatus Sungbacteria bacterium]
MRFFFCPVPFFLSPVLLIFLPSAVSASIVINEVLFDPAGDNDTGLEWVELYNNAAEDAALSDWQLYPDGAGYYTFPESFNLPGKGFVVVHLRASGTDSAKDLYYPGAGANMGNSSGSVALFSGPHGKDTIKDFMRYQKSGASERKTWEPAAAEAGFWQTGTYIDISNLVKGDALGLAADGVTAGFASAWEIYKNPSPASSNTGPQSSGIPNSGEEAGTAPPPSNTTPNYIIPRLEVEIRTNESAIAGASHDFHGRAFSKSGSMMSEASVRYLWNFGDGSLAEGASITHTYRIPGVYAVSLNVNSGMAVGSAYFDITVRENTVKIENVRVGDDGFIVLKNSSNNSFDLTGWIIKDGAGNSFTIPQDTRLRAERTLTLPNEITGLTLNGYPPTLYYGNLKVADSWVTEDRKVLYNAVPPKANVSLAVNSSPVAGDHTDQTVVIENKTTTLQENSSPLDAKPAADQGTREFWFLGLAAGLAMAGGGTTVFLRRKFIANV